MTVGSALILYALAVGFLGPVGFSHALWPVRAPRLGAAAVLAAAWSVPIALVLAGVMIALPATALFDDLGRLIGACIARLRTAYGTPGGAVIVTAGQGLTMAIIGRIVWGTGRVARRRRAQGRHHRVLLRLAAHRRPGLPALVLDCPSTAAYSVAGRHPAVVVTSGAIDQLTGPQLGAVLAHEHAHLRARHHRWQAAASLVCDTLPIIPLLRQAPSRVGRLLEMEADELAADHHEPGVIASALIVLGSAGRRTALGPVIRSASTLTRPGADAAARIDRLLCRTGHLNRARRTLACAGIVALSGAPFLMAAAPVLVALQ